MPLTPADVRNKQFSTTRLRPGYDEEEVDAFLDEVEAELDRLIQENEELRAKLAELLRGGKSAVPALSSPLSDPKQDMMAPEPRVEPERRQPEPMMGGGMSSHIEDNMDTAARVLSLAQQTADQAIADARREADETLGRARREADEVLTKARRQAEQITGDARARAESLERDAQERHRQAMGSLVQTREELERRVDDLSFDVVALEGTGSVDRKRGLLLAGLAQEDARPAIVYCGTRKDTEAVGELLCAHGLRATVYHAGLDAGVRHAAQDAFMRGEADVVVATNAFGQGIDKQDIRSVWHWALPTSVEAYYQEAGRAGRDGAPARAVLLAMRGDLGRLIQFIKRSQIDVEEVRRAVAGIGAVVEDGPYGGVAELDPRRQDDRERITLAVAERAGVVSIAPAGGGRMAVRLTGRFDGAAVDDACRAATDRRWRAYQALKAFAEDGSTCRRAQLLAHFGDPEAPGTPTPPARCCDVCDPIALPELAMRSARRRGGRTGAGAGASAGAAAAVSDGPPVDEGQLAELKRWRYERADGKPAYTVATNAMLEELLRRRPGDAGELLAIRGVGPAFVDRHGDEMIALLAGLAAA